ncbi:hypothetical protein BJV74DRAFT_952425 [Russula compacta]|nr:hypothetical protein BJV74DRAFT_952425 [Russula compacta]
MDNSTSTEPQEGNALPKLLYHPEGWTGSGPHFRVIGNVIKIKESDGISTHVPSEQQRRRVYDEEGNCSEHVQLPVNDRIYQLWMNKIGPYLGDWVLGKGRRASPTWKLMKLPQGYTLWLHKTGTRDNPVKRTDAYLHGAPHLARDMAHEGRAGQCLCQYCVPGQNQTEINTRLDRGEPHPDDDDDDNNNNNNNNDDNANNNGDDKGKGSSSSSARPKGTGRGTRGPRRKRDRSPPIMAKDYRTGNAGASADGAGTA